MNKKVGIVTDLRYLDHAVAVSTPENPDRIRGLFKALDSSHYNGNLARFSPRQATMAEVESVHSKFYLKQILECSCGENPYSYDCDTYLMNKSLDTARLAAGGCFELADRIINCEIDYGFALVRPPGHHAEPGRGMGFCILNNAALTAVYLQKTYGLSRILILDFDVHHGNGTQDTFYESPSVLAVSLHQKDIFPFSGMEDEVGEGRGKGYNVNLPVPAQFGDLEYTFLVGRVVGALVEQYLPQMILVSAGYDGHAEDSMSKTLLTTAWFGAVTHMLRQFASDACSNRLLFILEGGYNPEALQASVLCCINSLLQKNIKRTGILWSKRANHLLTDHPANEYWSW
jgi:acetoin utilization deacetylase AcuC-like enzyme